VLSKQVLRISSKFSRITDFSKSSGAKITVSAFKPLLFSHHKDVFNHFVSFGQRHTSVSLSDLSSLSHKVTEVVASVTQ